MAVRVDHDDRDQTGLGGQLAVFAQAADVAAMDDRPHDHRTTRGKFDHLPRQPCAWVWPKSPMAIDGEQTGRFLKYRERRAGHDVSFLHGIEIEGNPHHAVRIVAAKLASTRLSATSRASSSATPPVSSNCAAKVRSASALEVGHESVTRVEFRAISKQGA